MPRKNTEVERFLAFDSIVKDALPQFHAFLTDEEDFRGFSVKPRDDGTFLAVAMGTSSDGLPVVCFGQGYGATGAIYGMERTLAANQWKTDKFAISRKK